ncbi:peptidylprolyl isomerase [Dokdonella sp. MW10]|uniref:peptidylprolyl isomerase n=1 Tax=Dokdonella sp. MW10 TaxID=2992926 RepID=UPI003F7DC89F
MPFPLLPARALAGVIAMTCCAVSSVSFAEDKLPPETVVASRGDATVTLADIDASMLRIPPHQRADTMNSPKRIEDLITQILLTRQLANAGIAKGLDKDPVVKHAMDMSAENVIGAQTIMDFREKLDVGDVEKLARERYAADPSAFDTPVHVTVTHILIDTKARPDDEAKALATRIHERAATEDFEALVMEFSDDPSKAANKGRIIDANSNRMDRYFAQAADLLRKPGELAPVTKSQFGYHVIKLESREEARRRTYDEVRLTLVDNLRTGLSEQKVKEYVDQLRSETLDANPDAVASLRTRYMPAPLLPDPAAAAKADAKAAKKAPAKAN